RSYLSCWNHTSVHIFTSKSSTVVLHVLFKRSDLSHKPKSTLDILDDEMSRREMLEVIAFGHSDKPVSVGTESVSRLEPPTSDEK
ncbi:unnamed protein product, partial [Caenorhabditis brenneri]